jgi:UDP-N-acetylglucosamine 2-epimerase (non-hydrolysing)
MHIPIFHLEAGNRSFDENIPEEINRKIVDHLSDINMPLTEHARNYLLQEGIRGESIIKIGSCMKEILIKNKNKINKSEIIKKLKLKKKEFFIASVHREENVENDKIIHNILKNLNDASEHFNKKLILSTHPRLFKKLESLKIKKEFKNINFLRPLSFTDYISLQTNSFCVLSDSGTIAEESSILGFPAIMMRENHERPEAFDQGVLIKNYNNFDHLINSIDYVVRTNKISSKIVVNDYNEIGVSVKVVRNILSYIDNVKLKYK